MGIYFPVLNGIIGIIILLIFIVAFITMSVYNIRDKEHRDYKGVSTMLFLACVSFGLIIVIARKIANDWSTPTQISLLPVSF